MKQTLHTLPAGLLAGLLAGLCTLPAHALDAPLAADAHISNSVPGTNFGSAATLNVGGGSTALMRFDLSALPAGTTAAKLVKATLVLYVNRVGTPGTVEVQAVNSSWTEAGLTGSTLPALGGAGSGSTVLLPAAGPYVALDLTAQVKQWISNPGANFGLALAPALSAPGTVAFFDSKENTATGHVARLDLTLADQGPQGLPGGLSVASGVDVNSLIKVHMHERYPSTDSQWTVKYSNANSAIVGTTVWAVCAAAL